MSNTHAQTLLSVRISPSVAAPAIDTSILFSQASTVAADGNSSRIDQFLERLELLNTFVPPPTVFNATHAQFLLLGAVAAVESYFRGALRTIINIDNHTRENAYRRPVSFGAALHLDTRLMPEAVFENTTFLSRKAIWDETLKDLVGVTGNVPPDLQSAIASYVRVCQLRHCFVHRFGRLGAQNAESLGMDSHRAHLEKGIVLTYAALQECLLSCEVLVRTVNSLLFVTLVARRKPEEWRGTYSKDKSWFLKLWKAFAVTRGSSPSRSPKALYADCLKTIT